MATLHFTARIKQVLPQEKDPNNVKPFIKFRYLIEEVTTSQYPDTAILEVFDKEGNGSSWNNILKDLGHFPKPCTNEASSDGEDFEVYFHLSARAGVSQRTGKPYAMQDNIRAWKFGKPEYVTATPAPSSNEPLAYDIPGYNSAPAGMAAAPQAGAPAPSAAQQRYQWEPTQPQFPGAQQPNSFGSPYGAPNGGNAPY